MTGRSNENGDMAEQTQGEKIAASLNQFAREMERAAERVNAKPLIEAARSLRGPRIPPGSPGA